MSNRNGIYLRRVEEAYNTAQWSVRNVDVKEALMQGEEIDEESEG